jgi:hypothetical protein
VHNRTQAAGATVDGVNQQNRAGQPTPANRPQALADLLGWWKPHDEFFADGWGG